MLWRRGIRIVSITEQADSTATDRLLEGLIERFDVFYSENRAQEVVRGMREAALRSFFLTSNALSAAGKSKSATERRSAHILQP